MLTVEEMSEQIHKNYCEYVLARTGKPYWTGGDYSKLDEETKEADRIQARWMLKQITEITTPLIEALEFMLEATILAYNIGLVKSACRKPIIDSRNQAKEAILQVRGEKC